MRTQDCVETFESSDLNIVLWNFLAIEVTDHYYVVYIEVYTTNYRGNIQTIPLCDIITWWPLHANTHTHTTHTTHHTPRTTRRMTIMTTTAPPAAPAGRPIPPISALLACTWSACCYSGNIRSLRSRSNMTEWRDNSEVSLAITAYYTNCFMSTGWA